MHIVPAPVSPESDSPDLAQVRRLIQRKRSEKTRLEREIAAVQGGLLAMVDGHRTLLAVHDDIRRLFAEAMDLPRLSGSERAVVRDIYDELLRHGLVVPDSQSAQWASELGRDCLCPRCAAERDRASSDPTAGRADPGASSRQAGDDRAGAVPVEHLAVDPSARRLYHDLALRFHPDRARDDAQRARNEAVMRAVNGAYEDGDTDRLLDLCTELGLDIERVRGSDGVLAGLIRQYELLKEEVRQLRCTPPGEMVVETRRAKRYGYTTPVEQIQSDLADHLAYGRRLRDFVQRFIDGQITLDDLCRGPDAEVDEVDEVDESIYDEAIAAILRAFTEPATIRSQARRRKVERRRRRR